MSNKSKSTRWTEEQALAAADRLGQGEKVRKALQTPTLSEALERLGLAVEAPRPGSKTKAAEMLVSGKTTKDDENGQPQTKATKKTTKRVAKKIPSDAGIEKELPVAPEKKPAKKRRGVETGPIMMALKNSPARCQWGNDWLALDFPGGRLLSYNELYSILQYRKYEAFRYKKICREAIGNALGTLDFEAGTEIVPRPFFDTPTRLTLLRQGAKAMDREALTVIFKYMTDALRAQGVIEDDNPNIIVDIKTLQAVGPERLAMRLDRVYDWVDPGVPEWSEWTN